MAFVQTRNSYSRKTEATLLRYLEVRADEYEYEASGNDASVEDDSTVEWYRLERWVEQNSLAYDIIEGFFYVADAFFLAWLLWGCFVLCGICPDDRLDKLRRWRRIRDGRGVFSPLKDFDPFESSDDDDDASRDSLEYGNAHIDDEYGEIDVNKEENQLDKAAEDFFSRPERKQSKKQKFKKKGNLLPAEEVLLLDLEMAETPPEKKDPAVVFL